MAKMNETKKKRLLIWVAVVAIVTLVAMHWRLQRLNVPDGLVGTWKTTAPLSAERSLEITPHSITFATGPGTESTGFIDDIKTVSDKDGNLYTISYSADGGDEQVSFYYTDVEGKKTIQFKNQRGILWMKDESS